MPILVPVVNFADWFWRGNRAEHRTLSNWQQVGLLGLWGLGTAYGLGLFQRRFGHPVWRKPTDGDEYHYGRMIAIRVKREENGRRLTIFWEMYDPPELLLWLPSREGSRVLGFRKDGGGFGNEPLSEEGNGICLVDSTESGSRKENDLVEGQEYFYTFFVKGMVRDEHGNIKPKQVDSVRFSVSVSKSTVDAAKPESSVEEVAEEAGQQRARAAAARAREKLAILEGEDRALTELRASKVYRKADTARQKELEDEVRKEFETERMKE